MNRWTLVLACAGALAAASAAAQERGTVERKIQVGGMQRSYFLHVPRAQRGDAPAPLVLMFHGGGGTPAYAERESRFSELAEREGFLVAYPEGYRKSWNDGRDSEAIPAQRDRVDDLGFIAALLDDVAVDHKVDPKRVYATGISNGGIFSHTLAARMSARIAAIAPVAGGLAERVSRNFSPDRPVSVLVMHGTEDPLVPYVGGEITLPLGRKRGAIIGTESAVGMWAKHNGARPDGVEETLPDTDQGDGCRVIRIAHGGGRDATEVVLYRLQGGGHTWPGGHQYLPARIVGRVCRDVSASEVIWRFFKDHRKP